MQLIQNGTQGPTSLPAKQTPSGTPGYAYGGPPGATPSSIWDPDVANTLLAELANIVAAAGMSLDPTDNGQVLKALRRIAFPVILNTISVPTTLTGPLGAGQFFNVGGSGTVISLNAATFGAGQTVGFLAQIACTISTTSGTFYGGTLSGASIGMGVGSFVALQWDGVNWRQLAGSFIPYLGSAGQAYQNVLGSRAAYTVYTNSTGRPIFVNVEGSSAAANDQITLYVSGVFVSGGGQNNAGSGMSVGAVVPPGGTYYAGTALTQTLTLGGWVELR